MADVYQDLVAELSEFSVTEKKDYATLGYSVNGVYSVTVKDRPYMYRCAMDDGAFIEVAHRGRCSPTPGLRVIIKYDDRKQPYIDGVDQVWAAQFSPHIAAVANVGLHYHTRGSGMEYPLDWRLLHQMNPRLEKGLVLRIVEGVYYKAGALKALTAQTVDLTTSVPSVANTHRWVMVGIDVSGTVDTVSVLMGSTKSVLFPLTYTDLSGILYPSTYIPMFAVRLKFGQTQVYDENIENLFQMVSGGFQGTDNIVTSEGSVVVGADGKVVLAL